MDSYDYSNVAWETDTKPAVDLSPPMLSPLENPYLNGFSDEVFFANFYSAILIK